VKEGIKRGIITCLAVALFVSLSLLGCQRVDRDLRTINLFGFSVMREAFTRGIIPKFQGYWREKTGEEVKFVHRFAGSETITAQISAGALAEVAILSTEADALRLKEKGLVTTDWRALPFNGTLTVTPFIILVRRGNPKGIGSFEDLTREGIELVHPDPATSGGAQWAILAIYGAGLVAGKGERGARELLKGVERNVVAMPDSARKAMTTFRTWTGDALITYENEALLVQRKQREAFEIVYPKATILSEHKVVLIDRNIDEGERRLIKEFVDFLWSEEVQRIFCDYGFRSPDEKISQECGYQPIAKPFTVELFGGWPPAKERIIDGIWEEIRQELR